MGPNNGLKKKSEKSGFKDCFNVTDKMTLHISCVLIVQQNVCSRLKGLSTKAKLPSSEFLIIKKKGTTKPISPDEWHCGLKNDSVPPSLSTLYVVIMPAWP